LESVLGGTDGPVTRVRAAEAMRLAELLRDRGMFVEHDEAAAADARSASHDGAGDRRSALLVRRASPEAVGAVAAEHGIALSELVAVSRSLEDAFLELTAEAA
jgi:hypothetical protein